MGICTGGGGVLVSLGKFEGSIVKGTFRESESQSHMAH